MRSVALIPARSGSKRIKNKNLMDLRGHPLIAYSIVAAKESNVFDEIVVSTDSALIAEVAEFYGASVPNLRPLVFAQDLSPDIEWVKLTLNNWLRVGDDDVFSILRPTSPLRRPQTISSAFKLFNSDESIQSLRAIRPVKEHPNKMWQKSEGKKIVPLMPSINETTSVESHSSPFQTLPQIFVQDASLEFCRVWVARRLNSLTGTSILGFEMPGYEGFDINYLEDFEELNRLVNEGKADIPNLAIDPYSP